MRHLFPVPPAPALHSGLKLVTSHLPKQADLASPLSPAASRGQVALLTIPSPSPVSSPSLSLFHSLSFPFLPPSQVSS